METKDEVKSGPFLDVVVREGATILELFCGKNQTLLMRGDSCLGLDLRLVTVNAIRGLDPKGDVLASEGFDKALDITMQTDN